MKKILGIIILGFLLSGNAYAKIFNISCQGVHKIINDYNTVTESVFVEDLEIRASPPQGGHSFGHIGRVDIIFSSDYNGRYSDYMEGLGLEVDKSFKSIKLISNNHKVDDDYLLQSFIGYLSLTSGTYTGNIKAKWNNKKDYKYEWIAKCSGVQQLYTYVGHASSGNIGKGPSSGTAFFISKKGHLLTNNHVVDGCKVSKIIYNNNEYDTSLISTDKTLDLALLKAKVKPKTYLSFSSKEPKKRQRITLAGYPLGKGLSDDLKINDGRISALKGFENNTNEITVDVAINPGNSGGPIVNEKGQLIAIAVSGMSKDVTEGINFGIKASAAKNFLKLNKISPSAGYLNFSMDDDEIVELLEESTVYTYCN
jgi:S1-C subfamily serine protease